MPINQPSNQIKLTNVSVVRLKKGGKRFEMNKVACYKNKIQEWRSGVETDVDEVLQVQNVFLNVSKGQVAPAEDLRKAFGSHPLSVVVREILNNGEVQISDKERASESEKLWKDIAHQVSEKCVNPETQVPYPISMIEKAMSEVGFGVKLNKNAKGQALECIKLLQAKSSLPIQRSRMRVRVEVPMIWKDKVQESIIDCAEAVESDEVDKETWLVVMLIDPVKFKVIHDILHDRTNGEGLLQTVSHTVSKT